MPTKCDACNGTGQLPEPKLTHEEINFLIHSIDMAWQHYVDWITPKKGRRMRKDKYEPEKQTLSEAINLQLKLHNMKDYKTHFHSNLVNGISALDDKGAL